MADIFMRAEDDPLARVPTRAVGSLRLLMASLLAVAAVIHLVMVPSHSGEWLAEGVAFAAVGWMQVALAITMLRSQRRDLPMVVVVVNIGAAVIWVISRITGLPFGPSAGHAEAVGLIDSVTVIAEVLASALAVALMAMPERHEQPSTHPTVLNLAIPLAIVAISTGLLASPATRSHTHGDRSVSAESDGHAHAAVADLASTQAPTLLGASLDVAAGTNIGHDHSEPPTAAATAMAPDDLGFSKLMNGHQNHQAPQPMDSATTGALAQLLGRTSELIVAYPTIAAAEAAGYKRMGPYAPGLGTHYSKPANQPEASIVGKAIDATSVLKPMLIFDGIDPSSKIAGFMYIATGTKGVPDGFPGENDIWHYHTNVCVVIDGNGNVDVPLGVDKGDVDPAVCAQHKGHLVEDTGYMLHVWTVPGYENPRGVFHEVHPNLRCADGTYYLKDIASLGYTKSACADAA